MADGSCQILEAFLQNGHFTEKTGRYSAVIQILRRTTSVILKDLILERESRDRAVGITTGYGLNDQGNEVRVPVGGRIFTSPCHSDWPPIQWVPGALFPWVKRPRREADHSPPTSAEVNKIWIYTFTPTYVFMA
jgi:hypothetical protein